MAGDFVQTLLEVQFSHGTTYQGYSPGIPSTAMTYDLTAPKMNEWQKVLYLPQAYPDNYVDPSKFLDGLKKNGKHSQSTL